MVPVIFCVLCSTPSIADESPNVQSHQVSQPKKLKLNIPLFKKLGIKTGDKIVSVNDQLTQEPKEAFQMLSEYTPEDRVTVIILRKGRKVKLSTFE